MEEKYSFLEKKLALEKYIQNQNKKNYAFKQIKNLMMKKKDERCLFCESNNPPDSLFCSSICKLIFFSNIQRIIPSTEKRIRFPPFELLSSEGKDRFRSFIKENHVFDSIQIHYTIQKKNQKATAHTTFKLIKRFEIISIRELELELNYIYVSEPQRLNYISLEKGEPSKLPNVCLFCKTKTSNHVIKIDKHFITGHICSVFCFKSYMTFVETHINHPFKYFFSLPNVRLLERPELLLKYKNNDNCANTIVETEFNESDKTFTVNIIKY